MSGKVLKRYKIYSKMQGSSPLSKSALKPYKQRLSAIFNFPEYFF